MNKSDIENILDKYKAGTASDQEMALLQSWSMSYTAPGADDLSMDARVEETDKIWQNLQEAHQQVKKAVLWPRIAIAASLFILCSLGGYFWIRNSNQDAFEITAKNDLSPGKNSAVLTLANGKKILLNDAANGQLASEAGIIISKTKKGQLIYRVTDAGNGDINQFNTLETRNGEQYQVVLPDGSHIWLNATSSLRYPTAFSGKERVVELRGEGYFEIAKAYTSSRNTSSSLSGSSSSLSGSSSSLSGSSSSLSGSSSSLRGGTPKQSTRVPFIVKTKTQQVEVLGTHFNINAYDDEPLTRTTLMEGSVQVSSGTPTVLLKPGEQSILVGNQLNVSKANIEEAMSWKNGLFIFERENIESIMRKISRWYNVQVRYSGELPAESFSGVVNRFENVSQVLRLLSLTNRVHFKIEEGRIIVTK